MTWRLPGQPADETARSKKSESTWDSLVRYMQRSMRWQGSGARSLRRRTTGISRTTSLSKSLRESSCTFREPIAVEARMEPKCQKAPFLFPPTETGITIPDHLLRAPKAAGAVQATKSSGESVCEPMSAAIEIKLQNRAPLCKGPPPPPAPPPPPPLPGVCVPKLTRTQSYFEMLPKPASRLRTVNWSKIPENLVWTNGNTNIWKKIFDDSSLNGELDRLDWRELEGLFAPKKSAKISEVPAVRKQRVSLLDKSRAMQIGVGLRSLKMSSEILLKHLKEFDVPRKFVDGPRGKVASKFDEVDLKTLEAILPTDEEVQVFKEFTGSRDDLSPEEKFCLDMSRFDGFRVRLEALTLRESFDGYTESLQNQLSCYIESSRWLMESAYLADFMRRCLIAGNFLNSGSYAGNAPGFRLKDLSAFADCKSNLPDFTLLDFVVRSLIAHDRDALLRFQRELSRIDGARRVSLDDLREEIANLRARVRRVENAFESTAPSLRGHMEDFVESAGKKLETFSRKLTEANELTKRLAVWFCEDIKTFDIEECYLVFHSLCVKLTASIQKFQ